MSFLKIEGISKKFGDHPALTNITFEANEAEVVGLLGLNGAGKTTTLNILSTLIQPTSGIALIGGFELGRENHQIRKILGYLPDFPPLYLDMTVSEYVAYIGRLRGLKKSSLNYALEAALEQCNLQQVGNRLCGQLSRGYKQRVGLAQAIIHNPKILILDEPTTGLDPKQILDLRDLIKVLARQRLVILSSHILSEVQELCARALVIRSGTLLQEVDLKQDTSISLEEAFLASACYSTSENTIKNRVA